MAIIPALLSLLVVVTMYAGFAKLAARLYRRTQLSWKSAFGFGALVAVFAFLATVLSGGLPVTFAGLTAAVAVGAWFLASRATDVSGQPLGFKAAAALSSIAVGMAFAIGVVLAGILPAIQAQKTMRFASSSMEPSIMEGTTVKVNMLAYLTGAPKRWDIIVFQTSEEKFYAHRVIGLPDELVEYDSSKRLRIDGRSVDWIQYANSVSCNTRENSCREFIEGTGTDRHLVRVIDGKPPVMLHAVPDFDGKSKCKFSELGFSCKVPPQSYFVMGDNRDGSRDSRYLGFVPANRIGGRIDGIPSVK